MTKLSKSSNPVFLIQLGIWFKASSASSPGTSFFPRFLIEASAKREWLVTKRKGPAASYFIRWHMAYNKRRRIFEQGSRAKYVAACVWLWKQTKSSLKLWKYYLVSYHYSLKGRRLCRVTVINGSNDRLKELTVTLLNRANSCRRSQKTPAVT